MVMSVLVAVQRPSRYVVFRVCMHYSGQTARFSRVQIQCVRTRYMSAQAVSFLHVLVIVCDSCEWLDHHVWY